MSTQLQGSFPGAIKYYTNCRGVNYIPAMKNEWKYSGYLPRLQSLYPASAAFLGANKTTQWWYYNSEDNDRCLSYLRGLGINALRVFSDIYVWQRDRNKYINAIKDFHKLCDKYKIRVEWVLWDGIEIPDSTTDAPQSRAQTVSALEYCLNKTWHQTPFPFETSSAAQLSNFFTTCATPFLNDVVSSVSGYQSLWAFDIMNEHAESQIPLISSTSLYLSAALSSIGIGLTFGHGESFQPYSACPQSVYPNELFEFSSYINFASIHAYANSKFAIQRYLYEASTGASMIGRPAMINEAHYPDNLQWISNDLNYFSALNYGSLGFDAMIDHALSQEPFLGSQGVFFWDGTVRNRNEALAYIRVASGAGWLSNSQLNYGVEEKAISTNNGSDGGYWSGVLPEHTTFDSSVYVSANQTYWEITKNIVYNILPAPTTTGYNPYYSKNFPPVLGHPMQKEAGYGFTYSGLTYEGAYNMLLNWSSIFPPLSSLPDTAGSAFTIKNKSIIDRVLLLDKLQSYTCDVTSSLNWARLIGTQCDPNPIPSGTRLALSASIGNYLTLLTGSKVPAYNSVYATSSNMACLPSNCLTTGGGAIDWVAYDTVYNNIASNLRTCLDYMVDLGKTNDRYKLF